MIKNLILDIFPCSPIFGYMLRCESLEVADYVVGFRRLASSQNLTHI